MNTQELPVTTLAERTAGGAIAPEPSKFPPDLTLDFQFSGIDELRRPAGATLRVVSGPKLAQCGLPRAESFPIRLGSAGLTGQVSTCRASWWKEVVQAKVLMRGDIYFKYHVSIAHAADENFDSRMRVLARAGQVLYGEIFRPEDAGYERTADLGERLRHVLLNEQGLRIVVRSGDFFAPWNLLHLGRRSQTDPENFLGARHVVEHDVVEAPIDSDAIPPPNTAAVHFDLGMDHVDPTNKFGAVADFTRLVEQFGLKLVGRHTKSEFLDALAAGVDEPLFYFMCHGTAGDDVLANSDNTLLYLTQAKGKRKEGISPAEVAASLREGGALKGKPLVFINSCRAAKTGSIYYTGFAARFLNRAARAVIGPEIEKPVLFAREFARRFLEEFFKGGEERPIGRVLLELRREFLLVNRNPLGLSYALYRGANHYLSTPLLGQGQLVARPLGH